MAASRLRVSYAWVVLGLCFLSMAVSTGVGQSIIIVLPAVLADFGWSRTEASFAPAIAGASAFAGALLVGGLSERWDLRLIMSAGALITAGGLAACSGIRGLWQFALLHGAATGLGTSFLGTLPNNLILARWFERGRGTAIGIVASGYGAGMFVFMPCLQAVIAREGWRTGYRALAAAPAMLALLLFALQRSQPPASATHAQRRQTGASTKGDSGTRAARGRLAAVARRPRFWLTYAQFVLGPLSTSPVIVHQAALMRERGVGGMETAWLVAAFGLAALAGMIAAGALSDAFGRESAYTLGTVSIIGGCVALLALRQGSGPWPALAYAALFGFGFGTRPSMDAATASDIFRGPGFGLVYGALSTALAVGQLLAPVLAGAIRDATGSYDGAIVFCMAAVALATVVIWLAAPRRGLEPP